MTFGFQWHVTNRCNLRCRHCYQDDFSTRGEPGLDALKSMADRIFRALPERPVTVNITGGEPLLVPGIFDLVEWLHRYPNLDEAVFITNGTVASDEVLSRITGLKRLTTLKVSVEGADAAVNDAIRGEGNLRRVLDNLPKLLATGKDVVLMITLSRRNLDQIDRVADLATSAGAVGVVYERFVPLGRGRMMLEDVLAPADWADAVRRIVRRAGQDLDPEDLLPYKAFWLSTATSVPAAPPVGDGATGVAQTDEVLSGALCNLGDESAALMPDGSIYPCRRMDMAVGNVLVEPFPEILRRLSAFSVANVRKCLSGVFCPACGIDDCAGCRALARAVTGDPLADDPQCPLLG